MIFGPDLFLILMRRFAIAQNKNGKPNMNCCSTTERDKKIISNPNVCSVCKNRSSKVNIKTVKHWLKAPLVLDIPEESFHFCSSTDCSVVYFSKTGTVYKKEDMRARIGIKEMKGKIPVCYCFDITEDMIKSELNGKGKTGFSKWISIEVKNGNCACDVRNPSGSCCLMTVKQIEKSVQ